MEQAIGSLRQPVIGGSLIQGIYGRMLLDELILNINDISVSSTAALKGQHELPQSNPGLWQFPNDYLYVPGAQPITLCVVTYAYRLISYHSFDINHWTTIDGNLRNICSRFDSRLAPFIT